MMHPTNSNVLVAGTSTGFWRSLDGGATWANTLPSVEISDIEFKPGSASHVFASGYGNQFYYSTDTGRTWNNRAITTAGVDRMEIGVSPVNSNLIYFLCGPNIGTGSYKGLFTISTASSYGSAAITTRSTVPNIFGYDAAGNDDVSQTWRNISIYVSPTDAADIFTGGCFIWKSTDFGVTLTKSSGSIHADNHFILKSPFNNDLYSGCDGGLFKSTDGGTTWNSISYGIASTQFYRFDASATTLFRILGGAQDNSQMLRNGSSTFNLMSCCDGMDNAVDYMNHDIMYMCTQGGDLSKSTNGVDNSAAITQPTNVGDYWVTNINIHTTVHTTLFFGGAGGIRRSVNSGSTWSDIGASGQDGMAQGVSNDDRMYAASGLTLRRSDNVNAAAGSVSWTNVSGSGSNYPSDASIFITAIAVNPDNSDEVWITCCGFVSGQKVYRSLNGGTSWTNMSAGLPNLPVHSIVFEDNDSAPGGAVYIGTELGVYYRDNSIGSWIPYGNGIPNAPVTDLKIYYGAIRYIYASTYGRGMWYSTTYTGCTSDVTLSSTYQGYKFYEASNSIVTNGSMQGNISTEMHLRAGNYIQFTPGADFSAADGQLRAWIGTCGSGGIPSMRYTSEILQVKDPAGFFEVQPEPVSMQVQEPILQTEQGNRFVLAFHSDGIQETRVSLKDAKGETLGYFIRTVLPAGNYQLKTPEVNTRAGLQLKWQMGEQQWRTRLQQGN